jgi:hypothetical protein
MIRNSKAFGLALVAMLALGAFVAQAASASPLTVEVAQGTTVHFTGDQESNHKFTTPNGSVSCLFASFDATAVAGEGGRIDELTVAPTYKECSAFGFATAHVTVNGCIYTFTTPTKSGSTVVWGTSALHIVCPAGQAIEITPTTFGVSACTQFVGTQTPTGGSVTGKNAASSPMDVTLETSLSGIHYTGTGGLCGNSETHSDATYTGNSTGKCYNNTAHTAQVGCTFS